MEKEKMATAQISGNTNAGDLDKLFNKKIDFKKKRDFFITLNFEQDKDIEKAKITLLKKFNNIIKYLTSLKYTYILSCLEKNEKGYYHIHIFIQFNTPHKLSIDKMEGANIQTRKGSVNSCINYLKKDLCILKEFGTPNYITGNPSIKDISLSRFSNINENCDARYYRVYKEIKKDNQPTFNTKKTVYIIYDLNDLDEKFNDYQQFKIEQGKLKHIQHNIYIRHEYLNDSNIDFIFKKFNEPYNNKIYPADIENVIIETNNKDYNDYLQKYMKTTIKEIIFIGPEAEGILETPTTEEEDNY